MNETYQNRITDQICKIQNDRALIAFYDRLRYEKTYHEHQ